jgi:hypothetical protein
MDSLIEKYLKDIGIELKTWKKEGSIVIVYEQDKLVNSLLSDYIRNIKKSN